MYRAPKPDGGYIPAFTVFKLEGDYEVQTARMIPRKGHDGEPLKDKNGNHKHTLEYHKETRPKGYLVQFPPRHPSLPPHSVHIATIEKLQEYGFAGPEVPLVDKDGEVIGSVPNRVMKKRQEAVNA